MMSYNAIDVTRKLLTLGKEEKIKISHLKLQKILYFSQGWHLFCFKREFFKEEIQAWDHGPVVKRIYDICKKEGTMYKIIEEKIFSKWKKQEVKDDSLKLLEAVFKRYKGYSGTSLEYMTHQHKVWRDAFEKGQNTVMEKEAIRLFFRQRYSNS